ncbi:zinc-binding alcohol dehydrogenase [Haloferax gibbonsii ATCC 33959]|uniref:Zinc-binding alcohol dehydrogenase n=1 Tax=Haloferax gibbonsii (strain ATCC 33959 / DSM 4427 / JCM 8863 / NBRC 102184 / NCIMB 2188 / Ma 2.38) TaxID=1227459 RepID=M0HKV0_HALGM|nr:zinc-binding alcohol dehydrogenase [Haloferax gibbonsii ATCC 33959]
MPQPGSDDVLVEVEACGLNNTDIWTREAAYGDDDAGWKGRLDFPIIQGGDIAGTIADVGPNVSKDRIGERVLVDNALYADAPSEFQSLVNADLVGSERDGGYAEYSVVPAENAHELESSLSAPELATFPTAYVTAERMLNRANVGAGDDVLVTGASGGVGTGLVQLARRRGARVLGLTSSGKSDAVREVGADAVIARDEADVPSAIEHWTEDGHVDVVADVVGGELFQALLEALRPGGSLVTAGAVAGPVTEIDLRTVYLKQIDVVGSTMGTRSEFRDLVRYIENGDIEPVLAETYPLSEVREAQRHFARNDYVGNIVVEP